MSLKARERNALVHGKDYFQKENFFEKSTMDFYYLNEKIKGANPQTVKCIHQQALVSSFLPAKIVESRQEFHISLHGKPKRLSYKGKERFKKFRSFEQSRRLDLGKETLEISNGKVSVKGKKQSYMSPMFYHNFNNLQDILQNKLGGEEGPRQKEPKKIFASIFKKTLADPPVGVEEKQFEVTSSTFYTRRNN